MTETSQSRDILITGFLSPLGRTLVDELRRSEPDATLRILVEVGRRQRARQALDQLGAETGQIDILEGRIDGLDLGLSGTEFLNLLAHVTDIYHLAGAAQSSNVDRERQSTILRGARNIADAASEMKKLNRLNVLSTAFVSGTRTGVIMEDELDEGQSFRNLYEETLFKAEEVIQTRSDRLPVSVYRPTLMLGHSESGEFKPDNDAYRWFKAILEVPDPVPVPIPGRGHHPLNVVPVDFVATAMVAISRRHTAGGTFHLADPNPLPAQRILELVAEHAGKSVAGSQVPYSLTGWLMRLPGVERATRASRQALDEINQLTFFNSMNTVAALEPAEQCPPFPSYVGRLVDYVQNTDHEKSNGLLPLANLFKRVNSANPG